MPNPPSDDEKAPRATPPDDSSGGEGGVRARLEQLFPDLVKRAVYAGLGAVFTTEEGIRKFAQDFSLHKDVANFLVEQASTSKDEVLRIVANELRAFFDKINLQHEMQKLLTSLSFEIKTEVRFIPNDEAVGGVKPDVKREMSVKRKKD